MDVTDDAFYHGFVADTAAQRTDRKNGKVEIVPIPTGLRRGVPNDVNARLLQTIRNEDYAAMLSSLVAVSVPDDSTLQTVHFDATYDNGLITVDGYFSTVRRKTERE